MNSISGLPAHPLLVHIPVAMLPLAAFGVIVLLARRAWYERYRWAVLIVGAIGMIGAILAASSGESLQGQVRAKVGVQAARDLHDHVQAGELARNLAIVFLVALAAYVAIPWFLDRRPVRSLSAAAITRTPKRLLPVLMCAVAITAISSMVSIVNAGHTGASRAWEEFDTSAQGGSSGG